MMAPGGYSSRVWAAGAVPRLGIPGIRFVDGPRGVIVEGATTFPVSMARGATWDVELEERVGDAIGREMRALGGNYLRRRLHQPAAPSGLGPRAGDLRRGHISCSARSARPWPRGVQRHVMACVKHFALNSMENARFKCDVTIGERALHEVYLPHISSAWSRPAWPP